MHMEQEDDWTLFGWLWVGSATTLQNIKDRHSRADHRMRERIRSV